jgi:hypothetical protein
MSDEITGRIAPAAEPAQLTEHVNVLMTEETRAFLLGSKIADGARSEGAVARALIEDSIQAYRTAAVLNLEYDRRVKIGRDELAKRAGA